MWDTTEDRRLIVGVEPLIVVSAVPERYWSGGVDQDESHSVDVLVDGRQIQIGVCNGDYRALLLISQEEAMRLSHMLHEAACKAALWKGEKV